METTNDNININCAEGELYTAEIAVESMDEMIKLFGVFDENLKVISSETGARIIAAGDCIRIEGSNKTVELAATVVDKLLITIRRGDNIDRSRIRYAVDLAKEGNAELITELESDVVAFTAKGRRIKCKTLGQKKYVNALKRNTVVFGVGPAGTGKTYLAVAMAVLAYKNKEVEKIILTRPAVEAGERLGFLPGDMKDKLDPYLQPLYDALGDMIPSKKLQDFISDGTIQIAPLAYMRGRTLDRACVILDEAQNTNLGQLKMFLTRMGPNAKFIVTGDASQVDLPHKEDSGLLKGISLLKDIKGVSTICFSNEDIVRHPLVSRIVKAFEEQSSQEVK